MNTEEIKNKIKKASDSTSLKSIIYVFVVLVIASLIFQAGVFVGFHKASFGHNWENNYEKNFGMMHRGPGGQAFGMYDRLPNAHGAIGKIIKAEPSSIIVLDKDGTEKIVLISEDTKIRTPDGDGTVTNLTVDSFVVVIGSPTSDGQIEAKLVRIIPTPIDSITTKPLDTNSKQ